MTRLEKTLLDKDNKEILVLYDNNGKKLSFEQVAVIPYKNKIYAILHPIDKIEGVNDDEAIVFEVSEDEQLEVVVDEELARRIFDIYYDLLMKHLEDN